MTDIIWSYTEVENPYYKKAEEAIRRGGLGHAAIYARLAQAFEQHKANSLQEEMFLMGTQVFTKVFQEHAEALVSELSGGLGQLADRLSAS